MIARHLGPFRLGNTNPLRDRLLSKGEEVLAAGVARHDISSTEQATEMINGAYGWDDTADTSSDLATLRSLVRILDSYARPSDSELLHWL